MKTFAGEVLAPGGSLAQALRALEGGADAIYVGTEKYSARAHAQNLSLDDIAALTRKARDSGSRVYSAMNTIMSNTEVAGAVELAWELHWRGVSALIVQDLGLAWALKKEGPPLALHASTQAAIHSPEGVAVLSDLGFSRVVLARELTLQEIADCVRSSPAMEFEVFIHGALCYAASGLCMASGMELGRSANRGDCGQLCRNWYTSTQGEDLFVASMNDLSLGKRVRDLREIGVHSYKIEGRMKPPAYAYWTSKAYKLFLSGGKDQEAYAYLDEARLSFGRNPSLGYLDGPKDQGLVNNRFSQSTGLPLGTIRNISEGHLTADLERDLSVGDGILVLLEGQTMKGLKGQRFSVKGLSGTAPGARPASRAKAGERVVIETGIKLPPEAVSGTLLLSSRHDGKLAELSTRSAWRHPVPIHYSAILDTESGNLALEVSSPDFGGISRTLVFAAQRSSNPDPEGKRGASAIEAQWSQSGGRWEPGEQSWSGSGFPPDTYLVQSQIKEFRRSWYEDLSRAADTWASIRGGKIMALSRGLEDIHLHEACLPSLDRTASLEPPTVPPSFPAPGIPNRADLSPVHGVNGRIGLVAGWEGLQLEDCASWSGWRVLPLAPFVLAMEPNHLQGQLKSYREEFVSFVDAHPDQRLLVGLNNLSHIAWLKDLTTERGAPLAVYLDYGFHTANAFTPRAVQDLLAMLGGLPGQRSCSLLFTVPWMEGASYREEGAPEPDTSWTPPYFISRACMLRNSLGREKPGCPKNCQGSFKSKLIQGGNEYDIHGVACITYMLKSN